MIKSKAQQRLMFAAASGKSDKVAPAVAKEFIASTPKNKHKDLEEHHKKPKRFAKLMSKLQAVNVDIA